MLQHKISNGSIKISQPKNGGILVTKEKNNEPTIAPGMNTHDVIEEKASSEEIKQGESTSVTRLFLDRTPDE